jgi:hypothetical protein
MSTLAEGQKLDAIHKMYAMVLRRTNRAATVLILLVGLACGFAGGLMGLRLFLQFYAAVLLMFVALATGQWVIRKTRAHHA